MRYRGDCGSVIELSIDGRNAVCTKSNIGVYSNKPMFGDRTCVCRYCLEKDKSETKVKNLLAENERLRKENEVLKHKISHYGECLDIFYKESKEYFGMK